MENEIVYECFEEPQQRKVNYEKLQKNIDKYFPLPVVPQLDPQEVYTQNPDERYLVKSKCIGIREPIDYFFK